MMAGGAQAEGAFCADPGSFCGRTVEADCLSRVGAGAIASVNPECDGQLAAYRECLDLVAAQCAPEGAGDPEPPRAAGDQPDMLEVWQEVKESNDPDVLDAFAEAYPGGPLATLAKKKAATLREEAAASSAPPPDTGSAGGDQQAGGAPPQQSGRDLAAAAAGWNAVKDSWRIQDVETFLAAYPGSDEAGAAQLRIAELRGAYREAQGHLNRIGHSVGAVDGDWGPASMKGMRAFERAKGLPVTGLLSSSRLATLRQEPTPPKRETTTSGAQTSGGRQTPQDPQQESQPDRIKLVTAEIRVTVKRVRMVDKNCRTRVNVQSKALSFNGVELDCGSPVKVWLRTDKNGSSLSSSALYDNFDRVALNGTSWGYSGRAPRSTNYGALESISVRIVFR